MSTGISYLTETWNPIVGCSGKSCKAHCWARELHTRRYVSYLDGKKMPKQYAEPFFNVQFFPNRLDQPLHWKKPRRIGVCFTGDLFDEQVPFDWIYQLFDNMPNRHQYFFLTKQVENMTKFFRVTEDWDSSEWPNVFWGVSITDQPDADRMIPELLRIPGKRWISIEPQLGPIRIESELRCPDCGYSPFDVGFHMDHRICKGPGPGISWIVIGAESGPKRRPCPQSWMIDVVRQCKAAGVPVYVKQIQRITDNKIVHDINLFPPELRVREP